MFRSTGLTLAFLLALSQALHAQDPRERDPRRALRAEDYGRFESLEFGTTFEAHGRFLAYGVRRVDGTSRLVVKSLTDEKEWTVEEGAGARFAEGSPWFACSVSVSEAEREALEEKKKPIPRKLLLLDLRDGTRTEIEDAARFEFSEDGLWFAYARTRAEKDDTKAGTDLVVRKLEDGVETSFGNVRSWAWSDVGAHLALEIRTHDGIGNGVQVFEPKKGRLRTLHSGKLEYSNLTWREDALDLACFQHREHDEEKGEDDSCVVLAWRHVDSDASQAVRYDHLEDETFPSEHRVVPFRPLRWSKDGAALFFGWRAWEKRPAPKKDEPEVKEETKPEKDADEEKKEDSKPGKEVEGEEGKSRKEGKDEETKKALRESLKEDPAGVSVWHYRDVEIQPLQEKLAGREKRRSHLAAYWIDAKRSVALSDETLDDCDLQENERHAIGTDEAPYREEQRFSATYADLYAIDAETGERSLIAKRVKYRLGSSPEGRFFLFAKDSVLHAYDFRERASRVLSRGIDDVLVDDERKTLTDEKPLYGLAGWAKDESCLYVNSQYDLWRLPLEGGEPVRLTDGRATRLRHRRIVLDRENPEIDPAAPMLLSLDEESTKSSGFARLHPDGTLERLLFAPKNLNRLEKAEKADVYVYRSQSFDDSPDLFVSDASLKTGKQITNTNPQWKEFQWGRSELVEYVNATGTKLQGALFYPADYVEGQRYPMITYIYEIRSDSLHDFVTPSERSPYNPTVFTSLGYFVFQPDIVYRAQNPGLSAVECVVPAVRQVLATGKVDPDRVGLVGHSWGAYQTAFVVTQTDLFAAAVAGAPLTNMMSMSMSIYWNSGQTDAYIFHESQGRMDRPFWRDVDTYIANSPIFHVDKLRTPLLVAFGDEDGAVDWHQGIEFYNAARLAQVPLVMLVYPGENHGLRKKPNQVDYHWRIREWFGHYLKGEEKRSWIEEGVPHLDRQKELDEIRRAKKKGRSSVK